VPRSNVATVVGSVVGASRNPRGTLGLLAGAAMLFTVTAGACAVARHDSQVMTDGLSWFAAHQPTVVPFVSSMSVVAFLLLAVARQLDAESPAGPLLRTTVSLIAILLLGVLATPYDVDTFFNWTHMILGGTLFALQFALSGWLWWRSREPVIAGLAILQFVVGLLALGSLIGVVDVLLYAQIVFQLVFIGELFWLLTAARRVRSPRSEAR
jgi:hypothetical protein